MSICKKTIGIIGGGQLGRMLIQSGMSYPIDFHVYTDSHDFSCKNFCKTFSFGDLNDYQKIIEFGKDCDIITIEIENVNVSALKTLQQKYKKIVYPDPDTLAIIKDRRLQKQFLINHQIDTMRFIYYPNAQQITIIQTPCVNKLCVGGYDGYGTKVVNDISELFPENAIIEDYCDIKRELSVIVARNILDEIFIFPITEMVFNDQNMMDHLICPAENVNEKIQEIAKKIATKINLVGILAIELFESKDGDIIVNELAPRPHNSGHYSQDFLDYSQFDILMKCLLDLHLPNSFSQKCNFAATVNILGVGESGDVIYNIPNESGIYPHFYDKTNREHRKLGHVNIIDNDRQNLLEKIKNVKNIKMQIVPITKKPQVGVIMGSSSDLSIMQGCVEILQEFGIVHEVKIVSAHRTPELMLEYAKTAESRGLQIIIAGAGGAAHLPGMVASCTVLPVIGVPIKSSNSIDGWDSILSILQMPNGIPVATVNLNGAKNAGLLACRVLGKNVEMRNHKEKLKELVIDMNKNIL